ncbi:rhomboid family intramembrane serine protease [Nocardioides sp. GXQ0305]|uniref:rhomboid family intramembrane serine protease n=1 Tax=Nocardioides sp. GXQ0305 TaxID=3423912 RepID=UPI003D7EABE6
MRDAAVGFQCPSCVAEGARTTRQGRTTYGGTRSDNPALTSLVLIALNVAVWLAILLTGGGGSTLTDLLGLRPDGLCAVGPSAFDVGRAVCSVEGGSWLPGFVDGAWWQVATAGFTHVAVWHLAFNMLALWYLGPQLEAVFGRLRFLALYLVSLLTGSAVVLWASPEFQLTVGASGAIYGLFGALLVVARRIGADVRPLLAIIGLNVVITFTVPNISWQGHLGGFLGGVLVGLVLVLAPRGPRRAGWQWAGVGLVALVVLVATAARAVLA